MYITAAPTLRRNLAPFFPAPRTRNHPPLSCLYSLARISVRGIKREREREKHLGRVGKGRETRIKTRYGRSHWKIVTFWLISSNPRPVILLCASFFSLLYTTCSCDYYSAIPPLRYSISCILTLVSHENFRSSTLLFAFPHSVTVTFLFPSCHFLFVIQKPKV